MKPFSVSESGDDPAARKDAVHVILVDAIRTTLVYIGIDRRGKRAVLSQLLLVVRGFTGQCRENRGDERFSCDPPPLV